MQHPLRIVIIGVGIFLVVAAVLIVAGIFGRMLEVLYITLIILAFLSLLATILLLYAVGLLLRTINIVQTEVKPLLNEVLETANLARETAEAVRDTAQHAGSAASRLATTTQLTREYAVRPAVRAASLVLAGREMSRVFFGPGRTRTRYEARKRRQEELIRADREEQTGSR